MRKIIATFEMRLVYNALTLTPITLTAERNAQSANNRYDYGNLKKKQNLRWRMQKKSKWVT